MIWLKATGRMLTAICTERVTSGSVGMEAQFTFSDDWDGLTRTAVFKGSATQIDVLLTGDTCTIPWEVLQTSGGMLTIGVYGADGSGTVVIPTIWRDVRRIEPGTTPGYITPSPATQDELAQIREIAEAAEDLVLYFSASWNDDAEAYAVTTTATLAQIDEALAAEQRIEARLIVDNRQLLSQGTVYAERYSSRLNTVTIGFFGEAGEVWALTGTGGGWELEQRAIGGGSIELDTTLSQSGKAADAAAVGTALAAKGTYSKPSGGIPASDLAAGVIPNLIGYATEAWVQSQGYLTQHQSLAAYQTKAITDAGGYYTNDTVEGALQEIGAELAGINTLIGSGVIA